MKTMAVGSGVHLAVAELNGIVAVGTGMTPGGIPGPERSVVICVNLRNLRLPRSNSQRSPRLRASAVALGQRRADPSCAVKRVGLRVLVPSCLIPCQRRSRTKSDYD